MRLSIFSFIFVVFLAPITMAYEAPPVKELAARYEALAASMPENSVAILFSGEEQKRSNDVEWPFRQSNEVNYFTGSTQRKTSFALIKDGRTVSTVIFAQEADIYFETWIGRLPDFDTIKAETGADYVIADTELTAFMSALLNGQAWDTDRSAPPTFPTFYEAVKNGSASIWFSLGRFRTVGETADTPASKFSTHIRSNFPDVRVANISPVINDMREVKSAWELEQLQRAISITTDAQIAGMKRIKTADHEYQVEASIEFVFRDSGACCMGYPSIVASGSNATILHYDENNDPIERDQLLLADIGAEVNYYAADVTRTYPASGTFNPAQSAIYNAVLDAQMQAITQVKAGVLQKDIEATASRVMGEHLLTLGLIETNEPIQVELYYLHGLSHTLGMDVHDTWEQYKELRPNMVITIEPGLYIRKDDVFQSDTFNELSEEAQAMIRQNIEKYEGIGVRIEDDILVQENGFVNMSAHAPKTIKEIEALMAQ